MSRPQMPRRRRLPKVQRVAAYAVILREDKILLSRLSDTIATTETWTLPGGGLDHGEDPRAAVVREVFEETGLTVSIGETAWVLSAHRADTWRRGRNVDAHALRIVYDGWVPVDAPEPRTVEIGGSTAEARWLPLSDVLAERVHTLPLVRDALEQHRVPRLQRIGVYGLAVRDDAVLLTLIAPHAVHGGKWHLPGGGLDFGENPREGLVREFHEETGLDAKIGRPIEVDDVALTGVAPNGRLEEFHGVHLVFEVSVDGEPHVVEIGGTTLESRWVPFTELDSLELTPIVRLALDARR